MITSISQSLLRFADGGTGSGGGDSGWTTVYASEWTGSAASGKITQRAYLQYRITENTHTKYTIEVRSGIQQWNPTWNKIGVTCTLTNQSNVSKTITQSDGKNHLHEFFSSKTYSYTKGASASSQTITATSKVTSGVDSSHGSGTVLNKTSTVSYTFSVPAETPKGYIYLRGQGVSASYSGYVGDTVTISLTPSRTGYSFKGWSNSSSATTVDVSIGATIKIPSSPRYLYAVWQAYSYTVTLDQYGGSGGTTSVTAKYDSAMPTATMPTRTGYTFGGYYDATSGGTQYYTAAGASARTWNKASTAKLYARWTVQTSSVTLNMNGGSGGTSSVTATYDSAMPAITVPTLSGWTFQGYYDTSAATGGTQYYSSSGASLRSWNKTGSQTLYARWSRSVKFIHSTNSSSLTVTQIKGGTVTPPSITAISGWTALGWRDDTSAGAKEYGANNTTAFAYTGTATTLYAVYSRTLTLSYTNGGGSGTAPSNTTTTQYYNSGGGVSTGSFTLRANTFAAPTDAGGGWGFSKWGVGNANGTWTWAPAVGASASTSTAAIWTRTVTFKSGINSATSKTATQTRGSAVSVPSGTVTPSGWTHLGWRADTTASTASYSGSSFSPSATIVYAVFSRTLTLTYTNGGGTGSAPSASTGTQYYNSGNKITTVALTLKTNTFSRAGYYFSKWGVGGAPNETWSWTPAVDGASSTSTAAQWTSYYVTLRYNVNGGSVSTGTAAERWRASNGRLQRSTDSGATWVDVTHNIYTYNVVGDSTTNMWNVGTPPIIKTGYYVNGTEAWNTKSDGTGIALNQDYSTSSTTNAVTAYRLNGNKDLTANITVDVYPKWIASTYTVTLNKNGGTGGTDSVTATYNSAMPGATMPTRTGYTFNGYYDATSGGTQYYTAAGASTRAWNKTSNTTLYAQWTERTATLTYHNSGLSNSTVPAAVVMKYTTATNLTAGTAPSGYTFVGWATSEANAKAGTVTYTGTQAYKAANVVPTAATIYAVWRGVVTYSANGHGTAPAAQYMYYTSAPKAAAAISATGYTFNGWNTKSDGTGTNYTAGSSTLKNTNEYKANYNLYAKWAANTYTITFDRNGGSGGTASTTATYDAAMPSITAPTRAGYVFQGYYDATSSGTQYYTSSGTSVRAWNKTAATTLYAHWVATSAFTVGDYKFTVTATGKVHAEAADKTKTTYAAIPTTVTDPVTGGTLKVVSIDNCFNGCDNLQGDIFVSHAAGELESYSNVFSTTKPIYILATSASVDHNLWKSVANQKSNVNYLSADDEYSYIVNTSTHKYSIKVLSTTKTSYSNPKATLTAAETWTADSMANCFEGCSSLVTSPVIPSTITNMSSCFSGCVALVTAPTIPTTVTNMNSCFYGCNSLQHAPTISANVASMVSCFQNCGNLRGNIIVNNKNVTSTNIFTGAGSTQNQIYIINGLGSDTTLASTWRAIAETNTNVHYEIDDLNLSTVTFSVKRQIYTDNTTESINGYVGAYINSSFDLQRANIKYMPIGWTISWSSTRPVEKMGTTSIGNTITTQADSTKLYFNNIARFLTNNNDINITNYYTVTTTDNRTFSINRTYNATLSSKNKNVIDAFYKDSDYIYTVIDSSSNPKKVAAYAFNRGKTAYSNIPSTITVDGTNYSVTSLYYPSYNTSGTLDTNNYVGGCFEGCSIMVAAPTAGIPSTVTDIRNCFKDCINLEGNIVVNGNPSNYSGLFTGTNSNNHLYIVNGGNASVKSFWINIANTYNNVHYEGEDNPAPVISSILINRGTYDVNTGSWDEDDTGTWVKANIQYGLSTTRLPKGWSNTLIKDDFTVIFDDQLWETEGGDIPHYIDKAHNITYIQLDSKTLQTTTQYYTKSGNTYTLVSNPTQADLNAGLYYVKGYKGSSIIIYFEAKDPDGAEINYQTNVKVGITDYFNHEGTKIEIVYATFAMLDFLPGGHGMAIGQGSFREGLEISLPTSIGEELIPPYRTDMLIPTHDHILVSGKTYYNSLGNQISNPSDTAVEEYYEKVPAVDLNQRQLILGRYNKPDYTTASNTSYKFAYLIIGNGTSDNNRSNLFRVDETGVIVDQGIKLKRSDSAVLNLKVDNLSANRTIQLPNKDGTLALMEDIEAGYLKLTGGTVTGNTSFTNSVAITDLNAGQLVVNGPASIANNLNVGGLINNFKINVGTGIDANNVRTTNGMWISAASITNAAITNHGVLLGFASVGTPFQMYIADSTHQYIYKRSWDGTNAIWKDWTKLYAGYADSAGTATSAPNYLPLAGGTLTGDLLFSDSSTNTRQIRGVVGGNDYWRIAGGATAGNAGWMEIATADDGNEPIYVRQYTGAYTTVKRTLTLLDADGHTTLPGLLKVSLNSNTVTIGSQNANFTHIYNSASIPFIFNNSVLTTSGTLGNTSYPFSGLCLKGPISYKGTQATIDMIKFKDNTADIYGNGIIIGGGGLVVVGAGESADSVAASYTAGAETTIIAADSNVEIATGVQNGYTHADTKKFDFNTSGDLHIPRYGYAAYLNQSSGTETPSDSSNWMFTNSDGFLRKSTRQNLESHIYPYEAKLQWGGQNYAGTSGPLDAALVPELGANRFAFAKAAGITVQYSRDTGSTWTDYGLTDAEKTGLFSSGTWVTIGKADSTNKATANGAKYQLLVTLSTNPASIYTEIKKFAIYVSTSGSNSCTVTIQRALESTPTTFVNVATDVPLSGWSGWNIINVTPFTTYGNTTTTQNGRVRFIFKANGGSTSYNGLQVCKIQAYGGVGWTTPSNMALNGHLYTYDSSQNATFPAQVTATQFNGKATQVKDSSNGTAITITYAKTGQSSTSWLASWNGYELGSISASKFAPAYQYSTTDLTAGSSALTTGTLYFVYV